ADRLAGRVAVVGVGDTDYAGDWARVRKGERPDDRYGYAQRAFTAALADAGVRRDDIDGLVVGDSMSYERTAEVLGLDVRWAATSDAATSVAGALVSAGMAIATGQAERIALVYGNDQRSAGLNFGGSAPAFGDQFLSYVYFAP